MPAPKAVAPTEDRCIKARHFIKKGSRGTALPFWIISGCGAYFPLPAPLFSPAFWLGWVKGGGFAGMASLVIDHLRQNG
jgi:hypothetical protein